MKVALVIERMNPSRGGRETSTAQIAEALVDRGCEATILCQDGQWEHPQVSLRKLGCRGSSRAKQVANFACDVAAVAGEYDIVHATLPIPGANVYQPRGGTIPAQVEASRRRWGRLGWPRVAIFERFNACRNTLAELERRVIADERTTCLAVSEMVAAEFPRYFDRRDGVRVVYNGVNVARPDELWRQEHRQRLRGQIGASEDETVFLMVATNLALKGARQAIRNLARWNTSRAGSSAGRLVIVGSDRVDKYVSLARLCGVADRVSFIPPTPDALPWFAAADVCLLLSWYDPCSRTVLEAVRMSVPSITTVFNGAAEVLADGAGLVVASPDDAPGIQAAMSSLAEPTRREVCREACDRAADSVTVARHVEQLVSIYSEIVQ